MNGEKSATLGDTIPKLYGENYEIFGRAWDCIDCKSSQKAYVAIPRTSNDSRPYWQIAAGQLEKMYASVLHSQRHPSHNVVRTWMDA